MQATKRHVLRDWLGILNLRFTQLNSLVWFNLRIVIGSGTGTKNYIARNGLWQKLWCLSYQIPIPDASPLIWVLSSNGCSDINRSGLTKLWFPLPVQVSQDGQFH